MNEKNTVDLDHTRGDSQAEVYREIAEEGFCPFCWENFQKKHQKPIVLQTDWWIVTENQWPYEGANLHLLFVYKEHVTHPSEVSPVAWEEFYGDVLSFVEKEYDIPGGGIYIRFGDTKYTGASVVHFHVNLVVGGPKISNPDKNDWLMVALGYKARD